MSDGRPVTNEMSLSSFQYLESAPKVVHVFTKDLACITATEQIYEILASLIPSSISPAITRCARRKISHDDAPKYPPMTMCFMASPLDVFLRKLGNERFLRKRGLNY